MARRNSEGYWVESMERWQCNVTNADGERKTFTSKTPGKKGKLTVERKAEEWLESGTLSSPRLETAWEMFLASKKESCGTAWVNKLESIGKIWLLPNLKTKRTNKITQQDWQNCINAAHKAGRSKKTIENVRGAISGFYVFCEMNRIEMEEPRRLKIPKGAAVGEREILQPDDIKILFKEDTISHYGRPYKSFFIHAWRFIVLLGLRRGELAGIKHEDIKNGILHIRRSVNSLGEITKGKTENANRVILLPDTALKILEEQAAMLKEYGIATRTWVFPGEDGGMMDTNSLYKHWVAYRKQHGINSSLHELRHTAVSILKAELPEDLLKQLVGHSKAMNTGAYKHKVAGEMERTAHVIDDVFSKMI